MNCYLNTTLYRVIHYNQIYYIYDNQCYYDFLEKEFK